MKPGIRSATGDQFRVRSALPDLSVFQDENLVRAANRGKAMRDYESGSPNHQVGERFLHEHLGLRIQLRGGLVQNKNGRIFQDGARDGNALSLSPAQARSPLANHGVVPLRQLHDEIVRQRGLRRSDDFLPGNIRQTVANVVPHGVVKQDVLLGDHGDLFAQRLDGHFPDVQFIDADGARGGLIKSRQQIHQRRFSGPARAYESNHFSAARAEINLLEHLSRIGVIRKAHVLKNDFLRKRRQRLRARLFALLFFAVEIGKYLRARSLRELKLLVHLADALQGHVGIKHGKKKRYKNSRRHQAVLDLIAGIQNEQRDNQGAQQIHHRSGCRRGANPAHILTQQPLRRMLEFGDFEIFHSEGLHDAVPADGLLQDLAQVSQSGLAIFRRAANLLSQFAHRHDDQRHQDGRALRHLPVEHDDDRQKYNQREAFLEQVGQVFRERDARSLHVVDRRGEQASGRIDLKKSNRLADDLGVHLIPQPGHRRLPHVLDLRHAQILGDAFRNIKKDYRKRKNSPHVVDAGRKKPVEIDGMAVRKSHQWQSRTNNGWVKNVVKSRPEHQRHDAVRQRRESRQHHAHRQPKGVRPHVTQQSLPLW